MTEADIVARLRRAWAHPASVPEDEMRVLISQAITEIEVLRVLREEGKVRGVWEAMVRAQKDAG